MGMQLRGRAFALRLLQIGFFVLGYVVVARVALLLTTAPGNVTPVWPISGRGSVEHAAIATLPWFAAVA
jgi:integral membrane sensor domain MASE1